MNVSYANMEGLYQWAEKGTKVVINDSAAVIPATGSKQLIMTIFPFLNLSNFSTTLWPPSLRIMIWRLKAGSGFKISQGKWIWFDLKDESGVVTCFMTAWNLKTPLEDGMKVRVFGYPKIYQKSGKFSFTVNKVELLGEGTLKKAYDLLKKKLVVEGLFAPERKRPLPRFPARIALITSSEAAAYTDFLKILNNRWGGVEVDLIPVTVQGTRPLEKYRRF